MTTSQIFLDANIALYAAGNPHPLKGPCVRLLEAASTAADAFLTSAEVLQEVLHVSRRGTRSARGRTVFAVFANAMGGAVVPVDRADVVRAAELAEQAGPGVGTRDLVHVATMQRHGLSLIASADQGFDVFEGVTRLDPAALDEWADPKWFPED